MSRRFTAEIVVTAILMRGAGFPRHMKFNTVAVVVRDEKKAMKFYHDKLGLQIERQNKNAIVFRCGSGTTST